MFKRWKRTGLIHLGWTLIYSYTFQSLMKNTYLGYLRYPLGLALPPSTHLPGETGVAFVLAYYILIPFLLFGGALSALGKAMVNLPAVLSRVPRFSAASRPRTLSHTCIYAPPRRFSEWNASFVPTSALLLDA